MFLEEMPEIRKKYPALRHVAYPAQKRYQLIGLVPFEAEYNGVYIADEYQVRIEWNAKTVIPSIVELDGRIASDYPHRNYDGSLCLATSAEMFRHFAEGKGLVSFLDSFLISYLFTYSYWEKYGVFPYGDRAHGDAGEIEYFMELLDVKSEEQIEPFLETIASDNFRYKGKRYCPCGSGNLMNSCRHRDFLIHLPPKVHLQLCLNSYRRIKERRTEYGDE